MYVHCTYMPLCIADHVQCMCWFVKFDKVLMKLQLFMTTKFIATPFEQGTINISVFH